MTKKKNNKQKRQKDVSDTSEEELNEAVYQGKCCSHVPRAVNFGRVKRVLKTGHFSNCTGCIDPLPEGEDPPEVWLCLQCGFQGCGRMSTNKHGLQHFKTIHSDCHSVVLSPSSGVVWCYDCDDEVQLQSSRNLRQCVEFIMKLKVNPRPDTNKVLEDKKPAPNKQSLIETVLKEQTSIKSVSSEVSPKKNTTASSNKKKENISSKTSVKGLRNLGNTCYFNAVMQNLSQTALLFQVLEDSCSKEYRWEVPHLKVADDVVVEDTDAAPVKIALPKEFQLVNTFLQFLKKMSSYSQNKVEVINPNDLFGDLQRKSPQFQYFLQQDSHELLRQFLDGIRQDEVKRQKKAILRHFHVVNSTPDEIDDEVKKLVKAYGCYASHTIVEKVFGGLLISTVLCEECKMSSQVFEPFMDMSLPLFEEKQQENCDQLCPLLDGGKQESVKGVRIRKPDQDISENGDDYTVSKSKKDHSKPSKHQERKMKQMEKKEKKKNKKAQNKKLVNEVLENPIQENEDSTEEVNAAVENGDQEEIENINAETEIATLNTERDNLEKDNVNLETENVNLKTENVNLETENVNIETENINLETENINLETENDNLETENTNLQTEEPNHINNLEDAKVLNDIEVLKEGGLQNDNLPNGEHSNLHVNSPSKTVETPCNSDSELVNISPSKDSKAVKSREQDFVVLFDGKVFLNEEPVATSSPTLKKNCEALLLDEELLYSLNERSRRESAEQDATDDIADQFAKCVNISTVNSSELEPDERMHNLSMQVKEVRIRRDSDRQESILSSSESDDDCETSKTNNTSYDSFDGKEDETKEDNWSSTLSESQTKEWILKSLTTLKSRKHVPHLECSVDSCLMHFTKPELLTGNNKFRCENCSEIKRKKTGDKKAVVYSNASKQLLIFSPPAVLTLHLKRFQQVGMSLRKVNRFVEFPLVLDLASYCSSACLILPHMTSVTSEILYSLYGIVEHSGHLKSGHYTAYVKASKKTLNHSFLSQLPLAQCDLEQLLRKFSKNSRTPSEDGSEEIGGSGEETQWYYVSDCHVRESSEAQVLKCQAYLLFYERIK